MRVLGKGLLIGTLALALGGCGVFGGGGDKKPKTPTLGDRVPILTSESGVEVDSGLADVAITLPLAVANPDWAQSGGNGSKSMGHVALPDTLNVAWTAKVRGSDPYERLGAAPIVADGKLFVVDTRANLNAYNAATGALLWSSKIGDPKEIAGGRSIWTGEMTGNAGVLFGGGASYEGGRVYAVNGLGDIGAYDATTGAQVWLKRPGGPLRGSPGVGLGNVYVMSQDNQIYALKTSDGTLEWQRSGTLESAGVFGVAAPAVGQGTVIAGYSSGELSGYRYENGQEVWQDALSRTSISTAVATISDIDADPVIDQGRVFAIGQGGRMISIDILTGQRLWEINVAGIATPWVAGEWLFVVTDEAKLLCISRANGKLRWEAQLDRYENEKKKTKPINWTGPVLAGNRLVVASSTGQVVFASPTDGSVVNTLKLKDGVDLPPVVAGNILYILDDGGKLTAWK